MQGVSGVRPRRAATRPLRRDGRERLPLQDRGAPPPAGDRAGAGGARQPGAGHLRPAPAAARPGRAGDAASRRPTEPISKEAVQAPLPGALRRASPSSTSSTARPDLRDVRDTNECHVYVTVEERGRVMAFSAIDNLWKGASGQGDPEPQPDARPRRDGGADVSERARLLQVALGRCAGRGRGARPSPARARLPRRRRPLRAQGRRQDRRRPGRLRRGGGRLVDGADPQRLGGGADPGLPRASSTLDRVRAAVVNSGNANAETGEQGYADALAMCERAADGARPRARAGRRRRDRHDRRAAADRRRAGRDRRGRGRALAPAAAAPSPTRS